MHSRYIPLLASAALAAGAAGAATSPKALVIMLDGCRADAIENARMENLQALRDGKWQPGYKCAWSLSANTIPDAVASSAPNHTSIATGVTAAKTHVESNGQFKRCDYRKWPSWLVRLVSTRPGSKALFLFSWKPDCELSPDPRVEFVHGSDAAAADMAVKRLSAPDAPDGTLYFIDMPDHGGHGSGFYPYSTGYLNALWQADAAVGRVLAAIASRPTFAAEDWLIVVTADHGGYWRSHGMPGGQATTVPLLVAGRRVRQGRIPGTPHNYDAAPTALAHFGIDVSGMDLDGRPAGAETASPPARSLSDGLAAYLPFDGKKPANAVSGDVSPRPFGAAASGVPAGFIGGSLRIGGPKAKGPSGLRLAGSEKLAFENGGDFAFAAWVRMDAPQKGDPVVLSNKDWNSGRNPGVALIAAKKAYTAKVPGVCFNAGTEGGRFDLGTYDVAYGEWVFYAVTRGADGAVRFYQGGRDGYLYCMSENAAKPALSTGLPFCLGQDGTGAYKSNFAGAIDEAALWTRELGHGEVRRVYEAGRGGVPLSALLAR